MHGAQRSVELTAERFHSEVRETLEAVIATHSRLQRWADAELWAATKGRADWLPHIQLGRQLAKLKLVNLRAHLEALESVRVSR